MADKTFERLSQRLGLNSPEPKEKTRSEIEVEKFDAWMLRMNNIYYDNTRRMTDAYALVADSFARPTLQKEISL